ncbi:MAG TPA: hypothetical protein VMA36_15205 [Candidatus Limnocylindria bacterium]|jgi:hypothetical protein|nr:hypothetical protein [Candidatus Limnocylindria bacterium]
MTPTSLAALAVIVAANSVATPAPKLSALDPCTLISDENVFRLLGWHVTSRERAYHHYYSAAGYAFHTRAGRLCFLESTEGVVTVAVADANAALPQDTPFEEPFQRAYGKELHGYPASVLLFPGTAYIRRNHHEVSVKVSPNDHMASYDEVEPFVRVVVRKLG